MLADAGCPVGNQMVLMKGVNDDPDTVKELMQKLLRMRVRPYYMYMADETKGANHFRTSIETGIEIIENLRGHTSGLAIPHFVIDAPGGGGKIPLLPNYVLHQDEDKIILRNYKKKIYSYKNYKDRNNPESRSKASKKSNGKAKVKPSEISKNLPDNHVDIPVLEEIEN
jgi:lysine 2,3-aminomutase